MKTYRELEYKFRVHGLFEMPDLTGIEGIAQVKSLPVREQVSQYFDTPDFRLFRWGVTLRHRVGGPDDGWHIKLPVLDSEHPERDELQFTAHGETEVPSHVAHVLLGYTRGAALIPVAQVQTSRTPYVLQSDEGADLVEIVDDVVSVMNNSTMIERYREIEVESLKATSTQLLAIASLLTDSGAVPSTDSKLAHALGPKLGGQLEVTEPVPVLPTDPAALAVLNHLRRQTRALVIADVGIRRELTEGVHDLRVAARRLRSGLQVFKTLVHDEPAQFLRDELRWIANELGHLRDSEVMLKRLKADARQLSDDGGASDALSFIFTGLEESIEEARIQGRNVLQSPRYFALVDELISYTNTAEFTEDAWKPARDVLPNLAHEAWKKLKKDVDELTVDGPSAIWHETRIQAKRARYAVELLVPVFGKEARVLAKSLTKVTELLGDHQDCAVAAHRMKELASNVSDPQVAFDLGLMAGRELATEVRLRKEFLELWPQVVAIYKRSRLH